MRHAGSKDGFHRITRWAAFSHYKELARRMNIKTLIQTSFSVARTAPVKGDSKGLLHRDRSRVWVETLADHFRQHFEREPDVRVFSKHNPSHRKDFGLNEFLFDILVCRVDTVESAVHKRTLYYVRDVMWQVESELTKDSRKALLDFNKFVLGSADNKLFVGSQVSDRVSFLSVLIPAAKACQGNVFAALIPHPRHWTIEECCVQVWKFDTDQWVSLENDGAA